MSHLLEDWLSHGPGVLARVRENDPRKTEMHGLRPLKNGKSSPKNWTRSSSSRGSSGSVRRVLHQNISPVRKLSARDENSLTVQWSAIPFERGRARGGGPCAMNSLLGAFSL